MVLYYRGETLHILTFDIFRYLNNHWADLKKQLNLQKKYPVSWNRKDYDVFNSNTGYVIKSHDEKRSRYYKYT